MRSINPLLRRTLKTTHALQAPLIEHEGVRLLNFSSNDYLNLSNHPQIKEASILAIQEFGTSSSASRVLTGTSPLHLLIENRLKSMLKKESALLFNSGYQLNFSILSTLPDANCTLFLDHNCHRSLIEGALHAKAPFKRFAHNNMAHLRALLQKNSSQKAWIVTESLFSMDGDLSPLEELIAIKKEFNALLFVDDAHALGCMGPHGMGLAADQPEIDIVVGTFGKAFGSFGAFVATSAEMIEQLINFCPAFIYTTALPPAVLGSIHCALNLIPTMDQERASLKTLSQILKKDHPSHIVPFYFNSLEEALKKTEALKEGCILALPIRPPTVAHPMLRFSITAAHQEADLHRLTKYLI